MPTTLTEHCTQKPGTPPSQHRKFKMAVEAEEAWLSTGGDLDEDIICNCNGKKNKLEDNRTGGIHDTKSIIKDGDSGISKDSTGVQDYEYMMVQKLRHLATWTKPRTKTAVKTAVPVIYSHLYTDKDSGIGSPVECSQLTTLHDKEPTEEQKHHELGKKYLLKTYLNALEGPQDTNPHSQQEVLADDPTDYGYAYEDDLRIFWLEKIHAINKQIHRKEEHLLRLHAKVRRHQVKRTFQTKSDVLMQIDRLDTELAGQVSHIHKVEHQLFKANEQLKDKLELLESLGREFEMTLIDIQNWGTLV